MAFMVDRASQSAARTLAELAPRLGRLIARSLEIDPQVALSLRQYRLLERLSEGPRRTGDLAVTSGVSQATASVSAGALVGRGLVVKAVDPADRRATLIMLTPEGRHVLDLAQQRVMGLLVVITSGITPEQAEALALMRPTLAVGLDRAWETMRRAPQVDQQRLRQGCGDGDEEH